MYSHPRPRSSDADAPAWHRMGTLCVGTCMQRSMKISGTGIYCRSCALVRLSSHGKKKYSSRVHRSIMVHLPSGNSSLLSRCDPPYWGYQSSVCYWNTSFFPVAFDRKKCASLCYFEKVLLYYLIFLKNCNLN